MKIRPYQPQDESAVIALWQEAERLLVARGCPKLSLMVRSNNAGVIDFYRRLGYTQDEVVSLGRRLIPD
ncbi:MAG: GNAT family N-acetyltransferase [Rhodoferax sp.]|nr:GNAT family N-acetyltransferase [Rhodoferax sp.]